MRVLAPGVGETLASMMRVLITSSGVVQHAATAPAMLPAPAACHHVRSPSWRSVSYTHLTLPTICSV